VKGWEAVLEAVTEHVYRFPDTCSVYVVKHGSEAVLIDFGDGLVLERLKDIGVERVLAVLMTHHHRDQGQGLPKAVHAGIPIYVPHAEQDLFAEVNAHWQAREIRNNYNNRQDRFSLLESVEIAGTLKDYARIRFGALEFEVLPTPGHTVGSITLMTRVDGRRVAFTGDLICGPGKVWSLAATQWSYNGGEGIPASMASLLDLKEREPDLLLPSHGDAMSDPAAAIDLLVERLAALMRHRGHNPRFFQLREKPYEPVTPHLLKSRAAMANYYVLLSDSGRALLFDFGYDFLTGIPAGADRASRRPWLYSIPRLKRDYGVRKIDAVLLTHYHDDHVAGCNVLRDAEGAEVWAAEHFTDVLERPDEYDLPCLWYDAIPVDRRLPLEQPIRWEEYTITLHKLPGHTRFAAAAFLEVDGRRVIVAGDQYAGEEGVQENYVYANRFDWDDYIRSASLYRELAPDVIVTGHWEPLWVKPGYFETLAERGRTLAALHRELLPLEDVHLGAEGFAAELHPYQASVKAGASLAVQAVVRNPFGAPSAAEVRIAAPAGWQVIPAVQEAAIEPYGTAAFRFEVRPPAGLEARRARIAADIAVGGTKFGQQAEALITVRP
jgi:glyoxylase-like metal-dependent hydrolase (beta-lactamase superfamily II)